MADFAAGREAMARRRSGNRRQFHVIRHIEPNAQAEFAITVHQQEATGQPGQSIRAMLAARDFAEIARVPNDPLAASSPI